MSVSQAAGLQPWRHRDSREKPAGGNEGGGRIRIMPPGGDDKLVGRRLPQLRLDPNAAPHQGEFGAGFGPLPGGARWPPRLEIGAQIGAETADWGVDFAVKF